MYFDSLTYTAVAVLVIAILAVFRFCVCGLCGGPVRPDSNDEQL